MALIYDAVLVPTKLELVSGWMASQRWYAAKGAAAGTEPALRVLWRWRLDDPAGEVGVETLLVVDESGRVPVVYQVPLTYRGAPLEGAEGALLGTMQHSVLGPRWIYDAPHDPVYAAQLLALLSGRAKAASSYASDAAEPAVHGEPAPSAPGPLRLRSSRVLPGEQSNTSIVLDCEVDADGADSGGSGGTAESGGSRATRVVVKVFRILQHGDNPDVVLQGALSAAGCSRVPRVVGAVRGHWPDAAAAEVDWSGDQRSVDDATEAAGDAAGRSNPVRPGHLAFASEFLAGAEDAWRVALRSVADGSDFGPAARDLGAATAEVHRTLGGALGTEPAAPGPVDALLAAMRGRYADAVAVRPELRRHAGAVEAVLEDARAAEWPDLQRVHGDYHLGQVLRSPERGWVLVDFEGEPLRPLPERARPDSWLRDVAGMLRSLDYVGEMAEREGADAARPWVEAASTAFLDGYAAVAGEDPRARPALLAAFELDKACYEVVYESRNRPSWVGVPLAAVERLVARSAAQRRAARAGADPRHTGSSSPDPDQEVRP